MTKSFGEVLDKYRGIGPGFDFLRIGLAFSIVLTHSFLLTRNDAFIRGSVFWFTEYALVPMFFALSGFLIAGSAQRLSLRNFLINRGLRIVPALAVDIVVCSLIIGPIITVVYHADYFTDPRFFKYFLNIVGWIHYELPGVFQDNPSQRVNGALWTVPWEIFCYIIMSFLMITAIVKTRYKLLAVTAAYIVLGLIVQKMPYLFPGSIKPIARFLFMSRGSQLITAFMMGIVAFQFKAVIPHSRWLLAAACLVCVVAILTLDSRAVESVINRPIVITSLVYITVFIGLSEVPIPAFFRKGDYSYGVYLYHDPFLQIWISSFPTVFLYPKYGALALYLVGLPSALAVAVLSWHFIEKPILGLRKKFSFIAQVRGVEDGNQAGRGSNVRPVAVKS
ncbi:acyltransferase family protein [Rhizobium sp. F40D2]|uniref:acyltransferase family protein n=1 Tax=Rhizobium sp. F40D2 TaxID=3453141 RepID=UPI003F287FBC